MSRETKLAFKWLVLVWANAAVSFILALDSYSATSDLLGMSCGVFLFVGFYWRLDLALLRRNREELRVALLWGVVARGLMQFWPVIEIFSGAMAIGAVEATGIDLPFLTPLLITLVDGVLLSLLAGVLALLVRLLLLIGSRKPAGETG